MTNKNNSRGPSVHQNPSLSSSPKIHSFSPSNPFLVVQRVHFFSLMMKPTRSTSISSLPDKTLACIFKSLTSSDRNHCSLVCKKWLLLEAQTRHILSLNARSDLQDYIPSLFTRFNSITKLALKCDRKSVSINDNGLTQISLRCPNLTHLKLRSCKELTDNGIITFTENCKNLKKFSCGSCEIGAKGINAVVENCSLLEELSVKRVRRRVETAEDMIDPSVVAAATSLKSVCFKELDNGECFGGLVVGLKNLKKLELCRCTGDWDRLFAEKVSDSLVEVQLESVQVSDRGLAAISSCGLNLEILHLIKTTECTDVGLVSVAEKCKLLRELRIDGWNTNRIGDEGLIAIARGCTEIQELVLMGVNATSLSLGVLAANCQNLERLALCRSETIGDAEIACIAAKCAGLRKLCITGCPVSDHGMEALAGGCPSLVKVRVKKCRRVTSEGANWLRKSRESLAVILDTESGSHPDAIAIEGAPHDNHAEATASQVSRSPLYKAKLSFFARCLHIPKMVKQHQ